MIELINQVNLLYGADVVCENEQGNSANIIYEIDIQKQPAILRISRYSEQKIAHIGFELAWMNNLAQYVPQIAGPIPSRNDNLFEVIDTPTDCWIVCVFRKAPGHIVDPANPLEWNETLFHKIGELVGNIHNYTKPYVKKVGINQQFGWRSSYLFWPENNQWVDPDVQPIWRQTLAEMDSLTQSQTDFGIVHTDIHHQNLHIEHGNIVLFDFDDCEYNWYAYDLASTLFFATCTADYHDVQSGKIMLEHFGVPFFQGYRQYAELPAHWMNMFPLFLRYRRLAQYKYFSNLFHGKPNPHEAYLAWMKSDILNNFAYLSYDFFRLLG